MGHCDTIKSSKHSCRHKSRLGGHTVVFLWKHCFNLCTTILGVSEQQRLWYVYALESLEPLLLDNMIHTNILCAGSSQYHLIGVTKMCLEISGNSISGKCSLPLSYLNETISYHKLHKVFSDFYQNNLSYIWNKMAALTFCYRSFNIAIKEKWSHLLA